MHIYKTLKGVKVVNGGISQSRRLNLSGPFHGKTLDISTRLSTSETIMAPRKQLRLLKGFLLLGTGLGRRLGQQNVLGRHDSCTQ